MKTGTACCVLMFLLAIALSAANLMNAAPIIDDIECVGGCKCNDSGCCKCFTSTLEEKCLCKNCTCKNEDK